MHEEEVTGVKDVKKAIQQVVKKDVEKVTNPVTIKEQAVAEEVRKVVKHVMNHKGGYAPGPVNFGGVRAGSARELVATNYVRYGPD